MVSTLKYQCFSASDQRYQWPTDHLLTLRNYFFSIFIAKIKNKNKLKTFFRRSRRFFLRTFLDLEKKWRKNVFQHTRCGADQKSWETLLISAIGNTAYIPAKFHYSLTILFSFVAICCFLLYLAVWICLFSSS